MTYGYDGQISAPSGSGTAFIFCSQQDTVTDEILFLTKATNVSKSLAYIKRI